MRTSPAKTSFHFEVIGAIEGEPSKMWTGCARFSAFLPSLEHWVAGVAGLCPGPSVDVCVCIGSPTVNAHLCFCIREILCDSKLRQDFNQCGSFFSYAVLSHLVVTSSA